MTAPAACCNRRTKAGPSRTAATRASDLNRTYDQFVATYGPINKTTFGETSDGSVIRRMPNLVKFREDPDAMLVMSLEDYDEVTGKAAKAAIMLKDVVGKTPPVTHVRSAEEGLLVSLNQRGMVDLPFIGTLYGKPKAQIVAELGDLIFPDPQSRTWQTADAYLSGNVRAKLAAAERAGPQYARNAEALRSVQPEDVLPGDIDANLGAPWIPERDIQAFAADSIPCRSVQRPHCPFEEGCRLEPGGRLRRQGIRGRHIRLRHITRQWHLAAGAGAQHEDADHLRHDPRRRPRGARGQPGRDAGRPRKAKAHQGAIPLLGVRRSRPHRAIGAALQRHLQQFAAPPVRRLAPRLSRHEPELSRCGRTRTTRCGAA